MKEIIEKLDSELKALEHELRIELPKEIAKAVELGDLRENAEYHAALERQSFVKARIGQLRERLGDLSTMDLSNLPTDKAAIGSTLKLKDLDSGREVNYQLVLPEVADLAKGLISTTSPIGRGLMGKQNGDQIEINIPAGKKRFEILEVKTAHEND